MTRIHVLCAPSRQDPIRRHLEPLGDTVVHWYQQTYRLEGINFYPGDRLLVSRANLLDAGDFNVVWRAQMFYPHLVVELVR